MMEPEEWSTKDLTKRAGMRGSRDANSWADTILYVYVLCMVALSVKDLITDGLTLSNLLSAGIVSILVGLSVRFYIHTKRANKNRQTTKENDQ